MKPKVYLETTIPSFLTARPSRDIVAAGQQQATREWWDQRRRRYGLFVSGLVLLECRRGDQTAAKAREAALEDIAVLEMSGAAQDLAEAILGSGLIPRKATPDAVHIAIAAVHGMDFLLTWNCRHIANAAIVDKVRSVCSGAGFPAPVICTPFELMS
ncbi:MAG: type II toxin-antitoxin system VapC family toxin [Verrucomicrobiales bacterium]|nr:type II toxin-antitoxin system VapC family toxin [Verrucomicrobiales bacterium]